MNFDNEILNIPGEKTGEISAPAEPEKTAPKAKKSSRKKTPAERLESLYEQRERLLAAQAENEEKARKIDEQITKLKDEIHTKELRAFDKFCSENNVSFADIIDFMCDLTEKMTLPEAAEILKINYGTGDENNGNDPRQSV